VFGLAVVGELPRAEIAHAPLQGGVLPAAGELPVDVSERRPAVRPARRLQNQVGLDVQGRQHGLVGDAHVEQRFPVRLVDHRALLEQLLLASVQLAGALGVRGTAASDELFGAVGAGGAGPGLRSRECRRGLVHVVERLVAGRLERMQAR
jgi:hypothetical protein